MKVTMVNGIRCIKCFPFETKFGNVTDTCAGQCRACFTTCDVTVT